MRPAPVWFLMVAGLAGATSAMAADGWPTPPTEGTVGSVYDGDTLTLTTGDKVRLKWVNTPELRPAEPFGDEARQLATDLVQGKVVQLKLAASGSHRDSYGRVVAGISVGDTDLSLALVERGLAHVFIIPPDDLDPTALLAAQSRARAQRLGIWSTASYGGALHITSFHANASGDDHLNVNGEYLRICNVTAEEVSLDGWRLVDLSGQSHRLPDVTVPAGHTVQVRSGQGEHQADAGRQLAVHLGSTTPLWNNDHEVVTLYDPEGRQVDRREQGGR